MMPLWRQNSSSNR